MPIGAVETDKQINRYKVTGKNKQKWQNNVRILWNTNQKVQNKYVTIYKGRIIDTTYTIQISGVKKKRKSKYRYKMKVEKCTKIVYKEQ